MATYVFPAPPGAWGRTDQGVDFGSAGPVRALGAGKIIEAQTGAGNTGWPGLGTFILLELAHPFQGHQYVYYAEDINPSVHAGQTVSAGQVLGQATGGSTGIELGFGSGQNNLALGHAGYSEGVPTPAGKAFRSLLQSIASGKVASTTPAPAHISAKTTVKVTPVPNTPVSTPSQTVQTANQQNANAANNALQGLQGLGSSAQPALANPAGHNVWNDLVFAFVATAVLAVVAHINERAGRVLLVIMIGFLITWFLLHSDTIGNLIQRAVPQTRSS